MARGPRPGRNAAVAMRFDCNEIGDMSEVAAYGTAVTVEAIQSPLPVPLQSSPHGS